MNGSALGASGAPDTRRGLRTGCCWSLRGQRGNEKKKKLGRGAAPGAHETVDAQCVFRVSEGPEADAHARRAVWTGRKEWKSAGGSVS